MRWYNMGFFSRTSPLSLIILGTIIGAAGLPVIRRTARAATVLAVTGVWGATNKVIRLGDAISREFNQLAAKAKATQHADLTSMQACMHTAGVDIVRKGMEMGESINNTIQEGKEKFSGYIDQIIPETTETLEDTSNDKTPGETGPPANKNTTDNVQAEGKSKINDDI